MAHSPVPVMCGATESHCGKCSPSGNTLMANGLARRSVQGMHAEFGYTAYIQYMSIQSCTQCWWHRLLALVRALQH